ncbi:GNAT family N-acetyltransferase [Nesterenkonia sp. F]|uniref:GNAT family N-acetyltransferase n=1 Tax=Nesterenkonia sp. F TaxID=795955 RepID=UPI000255D20E|nr:GNAT family N-acetyltransferase [Nesterenkonia sp. F]
MEHPSAAGPAAGPAVGPAAGAALSIREPLPGEADAIAGVQNTAWAETYAGRVPESFYDEAARERRRGMWEGLLASSELAEGRRIARVAAVDGAPVGVALSGPCTEAHAARDEQLFILYVLAAHQGRGLGGALLEAVLGGRPAQLWVAEGNTRALGFYRRHGFALDGGAELDESFGPRELRMVR